MVEQPDNSTRLPSTNLSLPSGAGIVLDIGTGDGLFVYQCARRNPRKLYIGIDSNPRPLEKISEKIFRKPVKGGVKNVLFLQAAVEDLPTELNGLADEIHVHFPWGSLLGALAAGDEDVLRGLRRICAPAALLEVIIGFDPNRDSVELKRLGLKDLSPDFIDAVLAPRYRKLGFKICEKGTLLPSHWPDLKTSWAKRLQGSSGRSLVYFLARAVPSRRTH